MKAGAKGGLRIPRKGRIRAVLAVIVLFVIFYVVFSGSSKTQPVSKPSSRITQKDKPVKKHKLKKTGINTLSYRSGSELTVADVKAILEGNPPEPDAFADTVLFGKSNLAVYTSLDTMLAGTIKKLLKTYHPKYAAIAAVHPITGRVLALVDYTNPEELPVADKMYCRSLFPSASLFKIITAAAAMEKAGLTTESMVRTAGNNHTLYRFQIAPELRNFREISLNEAFAYSINPAFARLGLFTVGKPAMNQVIQTAGFNEPLPFEIETDKSVAAVPDSAFAVAELASGFNINTRTSPLFCSLLASAVANGGRMPVPTLVDSIVDITTGTRVFSASPGLWKRPFSSGTAAGLRSMMQSVARYGTARKSFMYVKRTAAFSDIEYGGKTGNIELDGTGRIDWFAGFARDPARPDLSIGLAVVTVHGPYWTVHSSFIGAEMIRTYMRSKMIRGDSSSSPAALNLNSRPETNRKGGKS